MRFFLNGLIIPFLLTGTVSAQITTRSHSIDKEFSIRYDNDIVFIIDQYYSSGANISYSKLIEPDKKLHKLLGSKRSDSTKLIISANYGHKIFTPKKIREPDINKRDRPYAGWHYLAFSALNTPTINSINKYGVELGAVGSISGIGNFQRWWHHLAGVTGPIGWDNEIANELVMNLSYTRYQEFLNNKNFNIVSASQVMLGNGNSFASQGLTFRIGKSNKISNSGYTETRMSHILPKIGNNDPDEEEGFFFYGVSGKYVVNDIFIEGSIFNDNSPHTEEPKHFVLTQKWGFIYSNYYTTLSFIIYRLSKEVVGADTHRYASVSLALRF